MKTVSIQDLKRQLAAFIDEVQSGETVLITRHGRPVARLERAEPPVVRVGSQAGRGRVTRLLERATSGRYLEILADDRRAPEEP